MKPLLEKANAHLADKKYFDGEQLGESDLIVWAAISGLYRKLQKYSKKNLNSFKKRLWKRKQRSSRNHQTIRQPPKMEN